MAIFCHKNCQKLFDYNLGLNLMKNWSGLYSRKECSRKVILVWLIFIILFLNLKHYFSNTIFDKKSGQQHLIIEWTRLWFSSTVQNGVLDTGNQKRTFKEGHLCRKRETRVKLWKWGKSKLITDDKMHKTQGGNTMAKNEAHI